MLLWIPGSKMTSEVRCCSGMRCAKRVTMAPAKEEEDAFCVTKTRRRRHWELAIDSSQSRPKNAGHYGCHLEKTTVIIVTTRAFWCKVNHWHLGPWFKHQRGESLFILIELLTCSVFTTTQFSSVCLGFGQETSQGDMQQGGVFLM